MSIKLAPFEVPDRLTKDEKTATETYAKFTAEPFEAGFGHTVGNSLRRVLLSSLEGASITSVRIAGAQHEFTSLPGVVEDVTDIVLNLKQIRFKHFDNREPATLSINVDKAGPVTAGDIEEISQYEIVNKDLHICTLDKKTKFNLEMEVRVGRGFNTGEENKHPDMPIGVIPIDSIFSPVRRVKYAVENTRVGQRTDYDKLIIEVWTDGRLEPHDALLQASAILRHHLDVFVNYDDNQIEIESAPEAQSEENAELKNLLNMSVNEIELLILVTPDFAGALDPHEVPQCGPGMETMSPSHAELYCKGYIEVPSCGPCGAMCGTPPCGPGAACQTGGCQLGGPTAMGSNGYEMPGGTPIMATDGDNGYPSSGYPSGEYIMPATGEPSLAPEPATSDADDLPDPSADASPQNRHNRTVRTAAGKRLRRPTATPGLIGPVGYDVQK